ncbi:MAG: FAD-dependent oxidoreductase [Stutzerimonas stutzeri]
MPAPAVDVVVIGGGIIGVSTALELAERGVSVALCEKGGIGEEQSSRNWGWVRISLARSARSAADGRGDAHLGGAGRPHRPRHRLQAVRHRLCLARRQGYAKRRTAECAGYPRATTRSKSRMIDGPEFSALYPGIEA